MATSAQALVSGQQTSTESSTSVLREGCVQSCQGYLKRRTNILRRWKTDWFSVVPGTQSHDVLKTDRKNHQTVLHSFSTTECNMAVQPTSTDPNSKDSTGFRIMNQETQEEIARFRAKDIVQMRQFMASLGATGEGVFSVKNENAEESGGKTWDVILPSEKALEYRQLLYDNHATQPLGKQSTHAPGDPTYLETMQKLPWQFYFPQDIGIEIPAKYKKELTFPGESIHVYDPTSTLPKSFRRPWNDTFLPPNGPPVLVPVSIGYGAEVGLEIGLQAIWDPVKETYFFLDHIHGTAFHEDPRPPHKPVLPLQHQTHKYGGGHHESDVPSNGCTDPAVIVATANRALVKRHGYTISANGISGTHGQSGKTGASGMSGYPGEHGESGTNGTWGLNGTDASDVIVEVSGNASCLHISGSCRLTVDLGGTGAEEVLFVNCRGGDGGNGGDGGDGGEGGDGWRGSNGHTGRPGGSGGDGQSGGRGGSGGSGGYGGYGGNAGNGGACIIRSADPNLLVLVEADCMAGRPGTGGKKGVGAPGGKGGAGGKGGDPGKPVSQVITYNHTRYDHTICTTGSRGQHGRPGVDGTDGTDGVRGRDGKSAKNGGILWVVTSPDGQVLYEALERYDAEVTNIQIVPKFDDGVFEPNEQIMVSGTLVANSGGMPLPEGAVVTIPSTKTVRFEDSQFRMPEVLPNQSLVIPVTYCGRIFDQPPPNSPGPFESTAEFHPSVELMGRPFIKSFLQQTLTVQYPVKLVHLRSTKHQDKEETSMLEIGVQNISTIPYGSCHGSGGRATLQIHLDARLIPLGLSNTSANPLYTVTFDPCVRDSLYIEMHHIPAGGTVNVQLYIQMESCAERFDDCHWQADLYLRDKLIEYNHQTIRISPLYNPGDFAADVLLVTDNSMTSREYRFWELVLDTFKVSVDIWDIERYNGFSTDLSTNLRHQMTWKGHYSRKMILFPKLNFKMLRRNDLIQHFHAENRRGARGRLQDLNSSFVGFMTASSLEAQDRGAQGTFLRFLTANEDRVSIDYDDYSGYHLKQPESCVVSAMPHVKWERKRMKKLEKEVPSQAHVILDRNLHLHHAGRFYYKYGSVDIRRIPVLRSCKLIVTENTCINMANTNLDDFNLTQTIPLASIFGQVVLMTLFGIPIHSKVLMFKSAPEDITESLDIDLCFNLPSGISLSKYELAMVTIAAEVADEVYNCSGTAQRMSHFAEAVQVSPEAYKGRGQVILRGLNLIKAELKERKSTLRNASVSRAIREIKRLASQIKHVLLMTGVCNHDLVPLPKFQVLIANENVYRCSQQFVRDGQWDLTSETQHTQLY